MDVLYERCAGLDVSKRDAKACVRVATGWKITQTTTTWTSMTNKVHELAQ
jgi:transposase